ncbi:MAG: hypothetical protein A2X80_12890 [Geobacteraceae bacterium GWB2_52_12]|nr:MAG: hypothetical protein A2X80_12890 [Geobacteraceae bacterium GWB2_52_12]
MSDKISLLLKRFAVAAVAHHEALEAMDEDRANAHARMITGLYKALLREGEAGQDGLLTLTESAVPVVAGMAAVYLMHLYPERCLIVLRKIAAEPGLLGFRAGVAVERWETGDWTPLT